MNFTLIDQQHKATFNRDYVACHEPAERDWLVEHVILHFPNFRKSVVEQAIQQVCSSMNITPRKRTEFLDRLKETLESRTKEVAKSVTKTRKAIP